MIASSSSPLAPATAARNAPLMGSISGPVSVRIAWWLSGRQYGRPAALSTAGKSFGSTKRASSRSAAEFTRSGSGVFGLGPVGASG